MTLRELQREVEPIAARLREIAEFAEKDEFAPWVVEALETAAFYAAISDAALTMARDNMEVPA